VVRQRDDIQKTGQAADTTLTTNTQSAEKTGTGGLQYVGNLTYDVVPRIGAGLVAVLLIGVGLWMMSGTPAPSVTAKL
jgi:hypothetical protein